MTYIKNMKDNATRNALIDVAEKLIAERGFSALSMREIQLVAGQSNKNVVQYYFGDIKGIISAIIETRMVSINAHRWEILQELDRIGDNTPKQLLTAFIYPLASFLSDNQKSYYASFLVQVLYDPTLRMIVQKSFHIGSYLAVRNRLLTNTDLDPDTATMRFISITAMIVSAFAYWERVADDKFDYIVYAQDLIDMATAAYIAPQSPVLSPTMLTYHHTAERIYL